MTKNRAKHQQVVPRDLRARCGRGYVPKRLLDCTLPPLFAGTTLEELDLPARAQKFFERKRYVKRPTALAKLSVRDLAGVRGLGLTSIIAIVEALHRCAKLRGFKPKNFDLEEVSRPPEIAPRDLSQHLNDTGNLPAAMRHHRLPPLPSGTSLADLRLRGRSLKFFQQNNLIEAPEKLAQLTLTDLVSRGGIGVGTVAEIVEAIYRQMDAPRQKATLDKEILNRNAPKRKAKQREIVRLLRFVWQAKAQFEATRRSLRLHAPGDPSHLPAALQTPGTWPIASVAEFMKHPTGTGEHSLGRRGMQLVDAKLSG